jgi:hypothetical protein
VQQPGVKWLGIGRTINFRRVKTVLLQVVKAASVTFSRQLGHDAASEMWKAQEETRRRLTSVS